MTDLRGKQVQFKFQIHYLSRGAGFGTSAVEPILELLHTYYSEKHELGIEQFVFSEIPTRSLAITALQAGLPKLLERFGFRAQGDINDLTKCRFVLDVGHTKSSSAGSKEKVEQILNDVVPKEIISDNGKIFTVEKQLQVRSDEIGIRLRILDEQQIIGYADFCLQSVGDIGLSRMDVAFMEVTPGWGGVNAISVHPQYRTTYHGIGSSLMSIVFRVAQLYGCESLEVLTRNNWFIDEIGMIPNGKSSVILPLTPLEMKKLHKRLPDIKIRTKISPAERILIGPPELGRAIASAA